MNVGDERSRSLWMDVDVAPGASKLTQDTECDTVVVGSGIAGLSTAYELSGQGQKVIVLDRGKIGRGMTARTTAHLTANNDDGFRLMTSRRGEKLAKDFYVSQATSITRIETIQSSEGIDCDFRRVDGFRAARPLARFALGVARAHVRRVDELEGAVAQVVRDYGMDDRAEAPQPPP